MARIIFDAKTKNNQNIFHFLKLLCNLAFFNNILH